MSTLFLVVVTISGIAQLALPRRLAFLPLLIVACHLGNIEFFGQLTAVRMIILLGLGRAIAGGYLSASPRDSVNRTIYLFAVATLLSSLGHPKEPNALMLRAGLAFNIIGCVLYTRSYVTSIDSFRTFAIATPLILTPLALAMTVEQRTGFNSYKAAGLTLHAGGIRDGRIRAAGVFRSPILAGTVGAVSLPFAFYLWQRRRIWGMLATANCVATCLASASSGPLAALLVATTSVAIWRIRFHLSRILIAILLLAILFTAIKGRPIWYAMASIDIVGGSTGWHRARLFDQGFRYLDEWWLAGTDRTRHWMATGVSWSPDHTDITNYYLHLGVIGGLALPICLIAAILLTLRRVGSIVFRLPSAINTDSFVFWCAGSALTAHSISFVSVSYFDQIFVLFYALIGAVSGAYCGVTALTSNPIHYDRHYQNTDTTTSFSPTRLILSCRE